MKQTHDRGSWVSRRGFLQRAGLLIAAGVVSPGFELMAQPMRVTSDQIAALELRKRIQTAISALPAFSATYLVTETKADRGAETFQCQYSYDHGSYLYTRRDSKSEVVYEQSYDGRLFYKHVPREMKGSVRKELWLNEVWIRRSAETEYPLLDLAYSVFETNILDLLVNDPSKPAFSAFADDHDFTRTLIEVESTREVAVTQDANRVSLALNWVHLRNAGTGVTSSTDITKLRLGKEVPRSVLLELDPDHGFAIKRMAQTADIDRFTPMKYQRTVNEFHQVGSGFLPAFVSLQGEYSVTYGGMKWQATIKLDRANIAVGTAAPAFQIKFPNGTKVDDYAANRIHTIGRIE